MQNAGADMYQGSAEAAGMPEPAEMPEELSAMAIQRLIEEANAVVRAAEERRAARRQLRSLIESIEREADLATTEEDYPGADWLKKEARRLRRSAFGAVWPNGKVTRERPVPTAGAKPPEPPSKPSAPAAPRVSPSPLPLPSTVTGDLAHWYSRWNGIEHEHAASGADGADVRFLLQARSALCGVHAYVIRSSGDPSAAKSVKEARALRDHIAAWMKVSGAPWAAPDIKNKAMDDSARSAAIRVLADGYCRAVLAYELFDDERAHPSVDLDHRVQRLRAAYGTMQYHCRQLERLGLSDPLADQIVDEMTPLADELGIQGLSELELGAASPPWTSGALDGLMSLGKPREEPQPDAVTTREAAIDNVLAIVGSRDDFGADPKRRGEDRQAIVPALDKAFALGVPQSNKQIRDALLDRWLPLLDGLDNYTVLRREVHAELERRSCEANQTDDEDAASAEGERSLSHLQPLIEDLRPVLQGKRLLMLGGVPRVHTPERLQAALGVEEVLWPEAKKTDPPDKFESDMRRADVILVVKNYARHAATHAANDIAEETGAQCVLLTAGYGVGRIVSQLHEHYSTRGMIRATTKS
jgi:hypothetical protein